MREACDALLTSDPPRRRALGIADEIGCEPRTHNATGLQDVTTIGQSVIDILLEEQNCHALAEPDRRLALCCQSH
jgi:hypothetical protein